MGNTGSVAVIGLGYIGLPTAAVLARAGHTVSGVDVHPKVVEKIVATTRGWRAVPIQIAAAESAIAHGDASAAALRIAAAWAVDAENPALPQLVADLAALPGGAQALGEAVAKTRVAPGRFVAVVTATTDGETRNRIVTAARRAGMEIDAP